MCWNIFSPFADFVYATLEVIQEQDMHGCAVERSSRGNHEHTPFRLSLFLIHRRMNRTVVCLRHSNVRETMAVISPAVHKQTHIVWISFLLRRMVAVKLAT